MRLPACPESLSTEFRVGWLVAPRLRTTQRPTAPACDPVTFVACLWGGVSRVTGCGAHMPGLIVMAQMASWATALLPTGMCVMQQGVCKITGWTVYMPHCVYGGRQWL